MMMKAITSDRRLFRLICGVLALLMLLSSCSGGEGDAATEDPTVTESAGPSILRIAENGASDYTIVYARADGDDVFNAVLTLLDAVKEKTGATLKVRQLALGETAEGIDRAILIGKSVCGTDRSLKKTDYVIRASGNNILINAQNIEELLKAMTYFSQKLIPNVCTDGAFTLEADYCYLRATSYIYKDVNLLGESIGAYTIVIPQNASTYEIYAAKLIYEHISSQIGFCLDIVTDDTAPTEREIVIGQTNRASYTPILYSYTIKAQGTKLLLQAADLYSCGMMADYVVSKMLFSKEDIIELGQVETISKNVSEELSPLQNQSFGNYRILFNNILGNCDQELYPVAKRNEMLLEIYKSYNPDVIGLQECSANSRKYSSIIAGLEAQGYREVPVTGCSGNLYTPVLYKADRFELVASGYRLFSLNADKDGSKSLVWAVLRDRTTKETFAVLSTHFTVYGSDTNPVELARVGNATEVLEEIEHIRKTYGCPVVIGGDLNCNLSSDALKLLAQTGVLAQTAAPVTDHTKTSHLYPTYSKDLDIYVEFSSPKQNASQESIDHIWFFNSQNVSINAYDVCADKYACLSTDHCPLIVDFSLGA